MPLITFLMKQLHRLIPVMLAALITAGPVLAASHERPRDLAQRIEALTGGGPYDPGAVPSSTLLNTDNQRDARAR
jgi:hypothetical protein